MTGRWLLSGAGNGLGKSHAIQLAARGAKVVVNDLGGSVDGSGGGSEASLAVVAEIEAAGGEAMATEPTSPIMSKSRTWWPKPWSAGVGSTSSSTTRVSFVTRVW